MHRSRIIGKAWYLGVLLSLMPLIAQGAGYPRDVNDYLSQQELCEHVLNDIYDGALSGARAEADVEKVCGPLDAQGQRLKRKYADDPMVMRVLNQF